MTVWRAIKMLLTLHCEESSRLMSDSFERDLSGVERWAVRLHFVSCRHCRRIRKQLEYLNRFARQRGDVAASLSPESRERIRRVLLDDSE